MKRIWLFLLLLMFGTAQSLFCITFSQLALGGEPATHYECILLISNMSDEVWRGKINTLTGNDEDWTVRWISGEQQLDTNGVTFDLAARGTMKITLKSFDGSLGTGYLSLTARFVSGQPYSSTLDLAVAYFYNLLDESGDVLDSVSVPRSYGDVEHMLPVEYIPGQGNWGKVDTGIAWSPSSDAVDAQFQIHFELLDPSGNVLGTKDVSYEGQAATFVSELFPDVAAEGAFVGRVRVTTSEIDIYTTALRIVYTKTGIQLTGAPPEQPFNL